MNNVAAQWSNFISNGRYLTEVANDPDAERRAEHRRAYEAMEAERVAALSHAGKVAERVTQFLEQAPVSLDGMTPRGALVAHLSLLRDARRQAHAAADRLAGIVQATSRRTDAQAALTALDEAVRAAYSVWVTFGSESPRPSERVAEREALRVVLTETEADFEVADAARFENDVAIATVDMLEEMLTPLRHAVLVESAAVIGDEIDDLAEGLRRAYGSLAALGALTRSLPKSFHVKLQPGLPGGPDGFTVNAADMPDATAAWGKALAALERDPCAEISVPGQAEKPPRRTGLHRLLGVS